MKKVLATVATLGLVAGVAATAPAVEFSAKGVYDLTGTYLSNGNGLNNGADLLYGLGKDEEPDDAWYTHTFKLYPTIKVNDEVAVKMELRFADRNVFGGDDLNTSADDTILGGGGTAGRFMDVKKLYMDYMSPVGKVSVGRTSAGAWYGKFDNNGTSANRIMWWPSFVSKPWKLLLFTQKTTENDATLFNESDNDKDFHLINLQHKSDLGTTAVSYNYTRSAGNIPNTDDGYGASNIWVYAKLAKDNFTLESELAYGFGEIGEMDDDDVYVIKDRAPFAFMADVGMKMDALNVGLLYFYMSGDDDLTDNSDEAAFTAKNGIGNDYNPYQILAGDYIGILNGDKVGKTYNGIGMIADSENVNAGVSSIGVHANYKVNNKLSVKGALGTAWANKTPVGWDDSYGIEFDLGASYKLYDNLSYRVHFGYLNTGDFFEMGDPDNNKTNNVYLLNNSLTMKF